MSNKANVNLEEIASKNPEPPPSPETLRVPNFERVELDRDEHPPQDPPEDKS